MSKISILQDAECVERYVSANFHKVINILENQFSIKSIKKQLWNLNIKTRDIRTKIWNSRDTTGYSLLYCRRN